MKKITLFMAFGLFATSLAAVGQTYQAPTGYTLKAPADFAHYEPQVIETVNWLEATPGGKEAAQRRAANQFLMQWMTGSPVVSVEMQEYVMKLIDKEPELLMVFMGGWSRYQLQHPDVKDALTLNTEAVKTVLKAYQAGGYKRNKQIEELVVLNEKGALPEWVKGHLKG